MGMTSEFLACLGPHISVYSLSVPSLQSTTDPLVRRAIREAYPEDATHPNAARLSEATVVRVTATAQAPAGGQFRRVAVVRIASAVRNDRFVYKILAWE